jgi:hypothetical protein
MRDEGQPRDGIGAGAGGAAEAQGRGGWGRIDAAATQTGKESVMHPGIQAHA